jgi:hypothetical protein
LVAVNLAPVIRKFVTGRIGEALVFVSARLYLEMFGQQLAYVFGTVCVVRGQHVVAFKMQHVTSFSAQVLVGSVLWDLRWGMCSPPFFACRDKCKHKNTDFALNGRTLGMRMWVALSKGELPSEFRA